MRNRRIFPEIDRWLSGMTTEQVAQVQALPVRRDMVTLLVYLRDHRITGTQSTGNLPLKAVREVTAQFVNPPQLDTTIGERTYRLRTEYDVWPLYFLHVLADVGGLLSGGQARRLRLTPQGEKFLNAIPPVQVWYLLATWWWQVNWLIAYHVVGMGESLPTSFEAIVLQHLLVLPINNRLSYAGFADKLMQSSGLRWSKPELPNARDFMHSGIRNILMNILSRFEAVELHFRDEKIANFTFQKLDAFEVTPFGRGLLQAVEAAKYYSG